ncbi:MAG: hypothetical protein ACAI35_08310 [Candidatus Methylacidiphilales bacterium]
MSTSPKDNDTWKERRAKASQLATSPPLPAKAGNLLEPARAVTVAKLLRLHDELKLHQLELKAQNQELLETRQQLEVALRRATELFDFAPVPFVTLSADGSIREINVLGARLLSQDGSGRLDKINLRFHDCLTEGCRATFDIWLQSVFSGRVRRACIVELERVDSPRISVEILANLCPSKKDVRAVLLDLSSRKAMEE